MRIFVINLDKDRERLDHMSRSLSVIRADWERFPAISKENLSILANELQWPLFKSRCTPGEIACALSHWSVWKKIVELNLPYALILEDDVHFSQGAAQTLADIEALANSVSFDIIKLETSFASIIVDRAKIKLSSASFMVRLRGNHSGAAAYVISKNGCLKLLKRISDWSRAIDLELFANNVDEIQIFQVQPAPFVQDALMQHNSLGFVSSIGKERAEPIVVNVWAERLKEPLRPLYRTIKSLMLWPKGRMKIKSVFGG